MNIVQWAFPAAARDLYSREREETGYRDSETSSGMEPSFTLEFQWWRYLWITEKLKILLLSLPPFLLYPIILHLLLLCFSLLSFFYLTIKLRRSAKCCILQTFGNHSVWETYHSSTLKCVPLSWPIWRSLFFNRYHSTPRKHVVIVCVPRWCDPSGRNQHRPIALSPTISNVFESIIYQLRSFVERKGLLSYPHVDPYLIAQLVVCRTTSHTSSRLSPTTTVKHN